MGRRSGRWNERGKEWSLEEQRIPRASSMVGPAAGHTSKGRLAGGGSGSSLHGSLESSLPPASPSLLVLPFFSLDPSVAPVLGW